MDSINSLLVVVNLLNLVLATRGCPRAREFFDVILFLRTK